MSQFEMDVNVLEKDSRALSGLFQAIVNDMKGSTIIWEDFSSKAAKLHTSLRSTIVVITSFLDAFQKVADLANNSRGATRDIGASLTRLCIRHRSVETKLRAFASAITGTVVEPLQLRLEEWKKTAVQLDKDHAKEYKKVQQEIKKASSDTMRLQKRTKKGQDLRHRLENAFQDVHSKYVSLEEMEKRAVRSAMIEERSRFCSFISFLSPLMEHEISMLTEVTHLQEIVELLAAQTADPTSLPQASEQVILDLKGSEGSQKWTSTPPGSPLSLGSHLGSHRSSACSINSSSSSSLQSSQSMQQALATTPSLQPSGTPFAPMPSSTLSHDSGYASQDFVPVDFRREIEVGDQIKLNSIPVDTEDELIDDGASPMSDLPSHIAGSTLPLPRPYSPNHFHPSASTPAFVEPSTFYERPHTISYPREHSNARPALTALTFEPLSNTKSQNVSNHSLPSNISNYAVPSNVTVTMRLPKMAEDGETVADIYARPLQGQRRSGVSPCPVAPPIVPEKFYTLQMQQSNADCPTSIYVNASTLNSQGKPGTTEACDGKTDELNAPSPHQSLLRSFSNPVQSTVLPTSGQNEACDISMPGPPPDTISEKEFVLTSENVTEFDDSGKSSTLPRMPQFKVPLMPQRYSTTLTRNSGNVGPPTLPKRSNSRLSVKPPPPVRCNSAKSASMERIAPAPAAPIILHPSRFRHSMDTSAMVTTEIITLSKSSDSRVLSASDVKSNGSGVNAEQPVTCQDTEDARSKSNAVEGSMHQLRQQAPPSDDADQLRPLPVQSETVIPLFEEVLECSFTQIHSPIHDSIATSVTLMSPELSGESSEVSASEDNMLEMIKRGVALRRTITNDRSAPRFAD